MPFVENIYIENVSFVRKENGEIRNKTYRNLMVHYSSC